MASEGMKNIRPEDLKFAAQQMRNIPPDEIANMSSRVASATPEELAAMQQQSEAQRAYVLQGSQSLKHQVCRAKSALITIIQTSYFLVVFTAFVSGFTAFLDGHFIARLLA